MYVDYCCTLEKQMRIRDDNDITGKFYGRLNAVVKAQFLVCSVRVPFWPSYPMCTG